MRALALLGALLIAAGVVSAQQGPALFSREWYQQFSGPYQRARRTVSDRR